MKNVIKIFVLTILTTLFYWYVAQMVPQKETHPPESAEVREDMSTAEMVVVGEKISTGKGTCFLCHTKREKKNKINFICFFCKDFHLYFKTIEMNDFLKKNPINKKDFLFFLLLED